MDNLTNSKFDQKRVSSHNIETQINIQIEYQTFVHKN